MHQNRIVIDFDDTISRTITRDWDNAEPIWPVINRINDLYSKGWQIFILTARGQLSCNGDSEKADRKYRDMIESWLEKYGVKYHELSFKKPLATYYVDDKAMTPEEFADLEVTQIKTGWSNAKIEKRGNRIYKTDKSSREAAKWYHKASPLVNVPKIYSLIGDTLCLEYLKGNGEAFKLNDIIEVINTFAMAKSNGDFACYVARVREHCNYHSAYHNIANLLEEKADYFNKHRSFMHGDLSIENIIVTDDGMYLIDPLWFEDGYASYLLDISKMLCSFRLHNRMFEYEIFLNMWLDAGREPHEYALKLLELSHFIRILKYAPSEDIHNKIQGIIECFNI